MVKVLVSGTRDTMPTQDDKVFQTLSDLYKEYHFTEVIEGGARGVDRAARHWAKANGIKCTTVPADWTTYGKSAGPIRNKEMLRMKPDLVVAFPGFQSVGTRHMISIAKDAGVKTLIYEV